MTAQHHAVSSHAERRLRLAQAMQRGIAIVPTAMEHLRNRDSHYPYRFDSHFYYLSGFPEPGAVLVIVAGETPRSILFCRQRDPERETWDGFRFGPEAAQTAFGFDAAYPIEELDARIGALLADQPAVFYPTGADAAWDARIIGWLNSVRALSRTGVQAPSRLEDVRAWIDEMRLVKDGHELGLMRRAAKISAQAHRRAMRVARPGLNEYVVEAELLHEFRRQGAQSPAYGSIVAGGANACVLHYVANDAVLPDGALLLIDAGCELDGYASDITRTFPVNGRFSAAQRDVYEIVLAAQAAALAEIRPGRTWNAPHDAAVRVLAQGMLDLGLLHGTLDETLEQERYKRFYMHRTGHWLGLDVHDAGEYKHAGEWRGFVPGMTLTVEPGLYIRRAPDVPEAFSDIGIRIEDDVAVTGSGFEILTADAPKAVRDIEAWMRDA